MGNKCAQIVKNFIIEEQFYCFGSFSEIPTSKILKYSPTEGTTPNYSVTYLVLLLGSDYI